MAMVSTGRRVSSVDVTPIADFDDGDDEFVVDDLVENAVVALAEAVLLLATQLFAPGRARFGGQGLDPFDDAFAVLEGNGLQFLEDLYLYGSLATAGRVAG